MNIEILGLIATSIIVLSFCCNGELKLRLVNSIGSVLFVIYGISIHAWSVAILNSLAILINIYKYYQFRKNKLDF